MKWNLEKRGAKPNQIFLHCADPNSPARSIELNTENLTASIFFSNIYSEEDLSPLKKYY